MTSTIVILECLAGGRTLSAVKQRRESLNAMLNRLFPDDKPLSHTRAKAAAATPKQTAKELDLIDCEEFARRINLPVSWVRDRVRRRHNPATRIPHKRFGKYVRFQWGSPELTAWIEKQTRK